MSYKHVEREPGGAVLSKEWNEMGHELERLETAKVDRFGDAIDGELKVTDLQVTGSLTVQGDVIAKDTQHIDGDVKLGNDDNDTVSVFGELTSGHSSGALQVKDSLRVSENVYIKGSVSTQGFDSVYRAFDTGKDVNKTFHLIGTYHGWDSEAVYIAGYNYYNPFGKDPDLSYAKKVHMGRPERLTVDLDSGNVGIGTDSPNYKLDVRGNIELFSPDSDNIYSLSFSRVDEDSKLHQWRLRNMNKKYGQNDLQIWEYYPDSSGKSCGGDTDDGAICDNRLTIKALSGNVGIGTSKPEAKLDVAGDLKAKGLQVSGSVAFKGMGEPDFDSDWFSISSQAGTDSYREIKHDLGDIPKFWTAYAKADTSKSGNTGLTDTVFIVGVAHTSDDDKSGNYGGVVVGTTKYLFRIWVPDANNESNYGRAVMIHDGWGGEVNYTKIQHALVKIVAWK